MSSATVTFHRVEYVTMTRKDHGEFNVLRLKAVDSMGQELEIEFFSNGRENVEIIDKGTQRVEVPA